MKNLEQRVDRTALILPELFPPTAWAQGSQLTPQTEDTAPSKRALASLAQVMLKSAVTQQWQERPQVNRQAAPKAGQHSCLEESVVSSRGAP